MFSGGQGQTTWNIGGKKIREGEKMVCKMGRRGRGDRKSGGKQKERADKITFI